MVRVLELFEQLCDAEDEAVQRTLAREPREIRIRVLGMLAADRGGAEIPSEDEVLWALAEDLLDDLSDLPSEWTPPRHLPDIDLLRELGRGGMGVVFEARQHRPDREVAVKFLGPAYASAAEEAQALATLRHPAIPIIYQVGQHQGAVYLVMERVRGRPLLEWAEGRTVDERLAMFLALCDAVQHAHDAGILHRDLKPSNVLVDDQRAWVLDFGLAWSEGHGPNGVIGTLPYIADEVLGGATASRASDVFSLGVLLAELLGGPRPTGGSRGSVSMQRRMRLKNPPSSWNHHPIPELNSIVRCALAPIGERYPTVRALARDIERFRQHRPPEAHKGGALYGL
ncbi:MAG: serine/threonine protein kinase, partial [Myxococcales bacterium]|nr:serine/threonine protein kinase [Myxococcales bacterium]